MAAESADARPVTRSGVVRPGIGAFSSESTNTILPGIEELWAETRGDSRVLIALLDGPVDLSHPCFAGANLTRIDSVVSGTPDHGPACRHGTFLASVIFGHHPSAVEGIAPGCRGLLVPIFESEDDRSFRPCSQLDLARAIALAIEKGAHIINISGGQFSPSGAAYPLLADMVHDCARRGVLIVAAVGNEGCECVHVPAALDSVLAVGAMDSSGTPLEFSNWGLQYRAQGILAPGQDILGARPGGGTILGTGTSFATGVVSGVAALLLSLQLRRGRPPDTRSVRAALLSTAIDCEMQPASDCRRLMAGRLNVSGCVSFLLKGETTMSEQSEISQSNMPQAACDGEACSTVSGATPERPSANDSLGPC